MTASARDLALVGLLVKLREHQAQSEALAELIRRRTRVYGGR